MNPSSACGIPEQVMQCLPERVRGEIARAAMREERIEEVRLHCERRATLTLPGGRNVMTCAVLTRNETDEVLAGMCENSVYAYRDTMIEGYIMLRGGIRVGLCGRTSPNGGKIGNIYDISTLAVRIPHPSPVCGSELCRLLEENRRTSGMLIYSPPGTGKTTLLRSLARLLASGEKPFRVAVVDTRCELGPALAGPSLCLDLLSGYPKAAGISIAVRTLGAEIIICDEIGGLDEAEAIREAHNCGVPLIATAHAGSVRELLGRSGIALLHRSGTFGTYVGLRRQPGRFDFEYDICGRDEADAAYLVIPGCSV